ncbi:CAP domain-containing protein [Nocardioides sp. W7]|uniref:CAP domain-containing protein n=1 Tax=Nocardioides sp. W7 TaxID=2931390 RepID=UPI001FD53FED|nr:CAP domain-containing protein [Nocardioides sp. W7]
MRLIRLLTPLLVVLLVATTVPAQAATPEQRHANVAHRATNAERDQRDLVDLRKHKCLQRFAVKQAKRMAAQRRMFHQDLSPVLRRCGMSMVGENVAYGFPNGRAVVRGWMNSEGHRANILQRRYRLMGIGARRGGGQWYVAQVFGVR